jgi:hypothetical protein
MSDYAPPRMWSARSPQSSISAALCASFQARADYAAWRGASRLQDAERTVTVNRPASDVFDYLADGTHNREWRTGVLEIERSSAADGQGATYRQVLAGPGGRRIDGDYGVTVFDPPRRLNFMSLPGPRARSACSSSPKIRTRPPGFASPLT